MRFMLLFSRQGKLRLQKWYIAMSEREKKKLGRELMQIVLGRKPKMCSFLEWKDLKVVYKRYASLYFCCAIEDQDNELLTLELIHRYVELLDKYFGSVCELDIIFNFEKAYFILDEFIMGGEIQDTSKKNVLKAIEQADLMQEVRSVVERGFIYLPHMRRHSENIFANIISAGTAIFWRRRSKSKVRWATRALDDLKEFPPGPPLPSPRPAILCPVGRLLQPNLSPARPRVGRGNPT
ncbi:AP-1 complex subunit sigma-1A-like [Amblyraja radiata]|uniref:AP-1 complex subunit sigma-1A-like n=1 Tax=Amblyraja radiata TaxID=386614 RepID=UPI001402FCDE|nr:AP-1 complex subunit sigma-1A-like [Amblyraja radiata]